MILALVCVYDEDKEREQAVTDVAEQTDKKKRFRSAPYPVLDLAKAIERTNRS